MGESPDFERQEASGRVPDRLLRHALTHHRVGIARGFAISARGSITYYVGITYVPAFLASTGETTEAAALWLSTAAALVVILVTPLTGALSDRVGRKPVLIGVCCCAAILPVAMFWLTARGSASSALLGALVLAAVGGSVSAVGSVASMEQFPGEGRLSGLALGVTAATAFFGGIAPCGANPLVERSGSPLVPGLIIAAVALCALPVLVRMTETRPVR